MTTNRVRHYLSLFTYFKCQTLLHYEKWLFPTTVWFWQIIYQWITSRQPFHNLWSTTNKHEWKKHEELTLRFMAGISIVYWLLQWNAFLWFQYFSKESWNAFILSVCNHSLSRDLNSLQTQTMWQQPDLNHVTTPLITAQSWKSKTFHFNYRDISVDICFCFYITNMLHFCYYRRSVMVVTWGSTSTWSTNICFIGVE